MDQLYFTTLVYYFAKKYIEKVTEEEERQKYIIALLVGYAVFCLGELGIFIYKVNVGTSHCKGNNFYSSELSELIVNGTMILLCIVFFLLAYQN